MTALDAFFWELPFVAFAAVAVLIGYYAYQASEARKLAARSRAQAGPDPVAELERLNTEIARAVTAARQTLEQARDAVQRGTR